MIRRYHCHPQISISARGPVVRNKPLHLRQSDLDGACGPHCVLMSLVILGLTKYRQVREFSDTTDKKLSKVWEKALEYYFSGCGPKELLALYAPYKERLTWRFAKKDYLHKAVECLSQGGICILGLSNKDMDHWVLAVGLSYRTDGQVDGFLLLDPSEVALPFAAWNATLSFARGTQERYRYDVAMGHTWVAIDTVLTIKLREARRREVLAVFERPEVNTAPNQNV